jgi:hypothetical protein
MVTILPRICSGGDNDVVVHAGMEWRSTGVKKMVLMITGSGIATGIGGGVSGSRRGCDAQFAMACSRAAWLPTARQPGLLFLCM